MHANNCGHEEMLLTDTYVCPNEFTGFSDARLTRSFLLLMFLGAERQQKLRISGNYAFVVFVMVHFSMAEPGNC